MATTLPHILSSLAPAALSLSLVSCTPSVPVSSLSPRHAEAPSPEYHEPDGRDVLLRRIDEHDVHIAAFGEIHLIDSEVDGYARRHAMRSTIDVFIADYLDPLAERGFTDIVLEHIWPESEDELALFYQGTPIGPQTTPTLYQNLEEVPSGDAVLRLLEVSKARHMRVRSGGMDIIAREFFDEAMDLAPYIRTDPSVAEQFVDVYSRLLDSITASTYGSIQDVIMDDPDARVIAYNGLMHNNTRVREENKVSPDEAPDRIEGSIFGDDVIAQLSDLHRPAEQYLEVDVVQRDTVDLLMRYGVRPLPEYLLLTRAVRPHERIVREHPDEQRLVIVYGSER